MIRKSCAAFFMVMGSLHFAMPRTYERIMPPRLPAPRLLVYVSGVAEMAGGLGLLTRHRRLAGDWLVATLVAIFPANVHMARHPDQYPTIKGGAATLWARLPLQAVFIAWARVAARR